jgi:hypothetical protein
MSQTSTHSGQQTAKLAPSGSLPVRRTPVWEYAGSTLVNTRADLKKVIKGQLPIGLLPGELISEEERIGIVRRLRACANRQYENFDVLEKAFVHGTPLVDATSLYDYLTGERDEAFDEITAPLLDRLIEALQSYSFELAPLIDEVTMLPYPAGVCREISIPEGCYKESGNTCTVLHCDDILRDGLTKPDFRIPGVLQGKQYQQFSICLQLEDGGYRPDDIIVHEKQYSRELESLFYGDGAWRFDPGALAGSRSCSHTPELRKAYMFSTLNFHDIRGGHPLSKRINYSVFFLYVPGSNTLYYYN